MQGPARRAGGAEAPGMNPFEFLFDTTGFPRRWECGEWTQAHGWLHIISDLGVWSAYFAIPLVLGYFVVRKRDLPFRAMFVLFACFILFCGATHLMDATLFWIPAYRLSGALKLSTAVVSWATVVALMRVTPLIVAMRSPEELEREVQARREAELRLQTAMDQLELRVQERTQELSRAVTDLEDQRRLLRTTLASIGDGVIVTDVQGAVRFVNPVAERLTGWSPAEAEGVAAADVLRITPEDATGGTDPVATALGADEAARIDGAVLTARDGARRTIEATAAPIRTRGGETRGAVLVLRDVTQRRADDEALRRETAKVRRLVDSNIIGIAFATGERVDEANDAYLAIVGASRQDLEAGRIDWQSLTPPEYAAMDETAVQEILTLGACAPYQKEFVRPDGSRVPVLVGAAAIDPGTERFVCFVQDMTHVKQVERELRLADRRKDEFLATLAHELRNPLAPIRNAAHVVRGWSQDAPEVVWAGQIIERQVGHMARLLEDLLDISRITRGKLDLRRARVTLSAIVDSAVETSRPLIDAHGHHLTVSLPREAAYLDVDQVRIAQVLANLLNNAAKYTDSGGRIAVDAALEGDHVRISVRDDGIGFAPEARPHLFEMFSQVAPASRRAESGGLGIGLALVKGLVEMHGGTVDARSEGPGKGSEFIVRLPVAEALTSSAPDAPPPSKSIAAGLRVLVADDNKDAAATLAAILRHEGCDVRVAHDGPEALAVAEVLQPELALLDIGMPVLDGRQVAALIRRQPWGRDVVLVAVTGWGQDEDRRLSREAGFDRHLTKPVDPTTIAEVVARAQRDRRGR